MDWHWLQPITWPNGIGTLRGGETVVADFHDGALWSTGPGGEPAAVLCRSASGHYDGLCIDDDDRIWVATGPGGTIEQRDRTGRLLDEITVLAIPTRSAGHPPAPARLDPAPPAPSTPRHRGETP